MEQLGETPGVQQGSEHGQRKVRERKMSPAVYNLSPDSSHTVSPGSQAPQESNTLPVSKMVMRVLRSPLSRFDSVKTLRDCKRQCSSVHVIVQASTGVGGRAPTPGIKPDVSCFLRWVGSLPPALPGKPDEDAEVWTQVPHCAFPTAHPLGDEPGGGGRLWGNSILLDK